MKIFLITGAIFALLSVGFGAFGAHALKEMLDAYSKSIWEKAVLYQIFHALALLIIGILQYQFKEINLSISGWSFIFGIILFSGSLYILALSGIKILGAVTPLGGFAFIIGWGWLVYSLLKIK